MARVPHLKHARHGDVLRVSRSKRLMKFLKAQAAVLLGTGTGAVVTLAAGVFTKATHGFVVGQGPFKLTAATTQPTGLPATQLVWIHSVIDANTFKVTSARGSQVALIPTTNGVGTLTLTPADDFKAVFQGMRKRGGARAVAAKTDADLL